MAQAQTIYEVLEQEHRLVSQLLERAQRADAAEREDLLALVSQELVAHSEAESQTFYAALREHEETRQLVEEAEGEHQDVAVLLDRIDHTAEEAAIRDQVRELAETVQQHVEEEEGQIFDQARSLLDDDQARELADRFQELKQVAAEEKLAPEDVLEDEEEED